MKGANAFKMLKKEQADRREAASNNAGQSDFNSRRNTIIDNSGSTSNLLD